MKFVIVPYIALGLMLSGLFGIGYSCDGTDFTRFYGSPFVYKEISVGSSLTYFYSVSGIILNTLIWSIVIYQVRRAVIHIIRAKLGFEVPNLVRRIGLFAILLFCTMVNSFSYITMGNGFEKGLNYWYIDMNETEERWDLDCNGRMLWNEN